MNASHAAQFVELFELNVPLFERLGWTLVHSVWQCALVAAVLALLLGAHRRASSSTKYMASCAAMLLSLLGPVATFVVLSVHADSGGKTGVEMPIGPVHVWAQSAQALIVTTDGAAPSMAPPLTVVTERAAEWSWRSALPWLSSAWLCGVGVICVRHVGGCVWLRKLRRSARRVSDDDAVVRLLRIQRLLGIGRRAILLAESALVQVPSVIGVFKPIVLLPCSALTGLSAVQLDAILAHELAHVRRHDYVVNLVQLALETLLFYHPAVWWIGKQIRAERENCCDDIAVAAVGSISAYGQALTAMETLRCTIPSVLVMGATGSSLIQRVRRLVQPEPRRSSTLLLGPTVFIVVVVLGMAACVKMSRSPASSPSLSASASSLAEDGAQESPAVPPPAIGAPEAAIAVEPPAQSAPAAAVSRGSDTGLEAVSVPLTKIAEQYAAAQIETIEARSKYAAQHPALLRAQARERELKMLYDDYVARLRATSEAASPAMAAPVTPFGSQSPKHPYSRTTSRVYAPYATSQPATRLRDEPRKWYKSAGTGYDPLLDSFDSSVGLSGALGSRAAASEEKVRALAAKREELRLKLMAQALGDKTTTREADVQTQKMLRDELAEVEIQLRLTEGELAGRLRKYEAAARVYYISGVTNSGSFPLPPEGRMKLSEALKRGGVPKEALKLGGVPDEPHRWSAVVVHRQPIDGTTIEKVPLATALNENTSPFVTPGDVIMVTDKPPADDQLPVQGSKIRIRGEVPRPDDYPWAAGMTLLQALVVSGLNPLEATDWWVYVESRPDPRVTPTNVTKVGYRVKDLLGPEGNNIDVRPQDQIQVTKESPGLPRGTTPTTTTTVPVGAQ
jgi:beta-lactamase regulating signal transducer with metallopeptidase domain